MKTNFEIYIIERVKQIRKEKGFSQIDLAEGISVSPGFIGKIESSNTSAKYNLHHINLISIFLNINPKTLFPDEPIL